ncbi:MAG: D-2-hydroxyacid dehydrogenase [Firmicutes bacterium]|nr:D-2-hydroxyacid dehydrogenase [Bacillota bacterium]
MKNVLVMEPHSEEMKKRFLAIEGYRFTFCEDKSQITDEILAETQIMIGTPTREMVAKAPLLEWVQLYSAGANSVLWLPENIMITNAYGAYGPAISEFLAAGVLMMSKQFPEYIANQRRHVWKRVPGVRMAEEYTVVSVGMGAIGTAFLKRMHDMGAKCYGVCRTLHKYPDFVEGLYTPDTMKEILGCADVVALCLPGTADTAGMFDEKTLRSIRRGALLLNIGRGTAIVTEDLLKLQQEEYFRGVLLDVTDPEPLPADHPLWDAPHVIITPHISGGFRSPVNYARVMNVAFENLERMARGEAVLHAVDRKAQY